MQVQRPPGDFADRLSPSIMSSNSSRAAEAGIGQPTVNEYSNDRATDIALASTSESDPCRQTVACLPIHTLETGRCGWSACSVRLDDFYRQIDGQDLVH